MTSFVDYSEGNPEKNKQQLLQQLTKLKELIEDREASGSVFWRGQVLPRMRSF